MFASFLPGIAMTLSTLVTTDAKVGQVGALDRVCREGRGGGGGSSNWTDSVLFPSWYSLNGSLGLR